MKNLLPTITQWQQQNKQIALATVIKVYGSAPRPLGAKMLISSRGDMLGSVSGGCVEGAVFEEAQVVIKQKQPKHLQYGIADELAFEVIGLACGGTIEVFVESLSSGPLHHIYPTLKQTLEANQLCVVITALTGSFKGQKLLVSNAGVIQSTFNESILHNQLKTFALNIMSTQQSQQLTLEVAGETVAFFADVYPPPPKLIIVGAVHIAQTLVTFANQLGFQTIVVDARSTFATQQRFPHAHDLIVQWPAEALAEMMLDEASYIVFLSHDEKLDNPALAVALKSPAYYIGALGSKSTHARRLTALKTMGFNDAELSRIHAPIGLNLGAKRPEEIAVSIIAQIVAIINQ